MSDRLGSDGLGHQVVAGLSSAGTTGCSVQIIRSSVKAREKMHGGRDTKLLDVSLLLRAHTGGSALGCRAIRRGDACGRKLLKRDTAGRLGADRFRRAVSAARSSALFGQLAFRAMLHELKPMPGGALRHGQRLPGTSLLSPEGSEGSPSEHWLPARSKEGLTRICIARGSRSALTRRTSMRISEKFPSLQEGVDGSRLVKSFSLGGCIGANLVPSTDRDRGPGGRVDDHSDDGDTSAGQDAFQAQTSRESRKGRCLRQLGFTAELSNLENRSRPPVRFSDGSKTTVDGRVPDGARLQARPDFLSAGDSQGVRSGHSVVHAPVLEYLSKWFGNHLALLRVNWTTRARGGGVVLEGDLYAPTSLCRMSPGETGGVWVGNGVRLVVPAGSWRDVQKLASSHTASGVRTQLSSKSSQDTGQVLRGTGGSRWGNPVAWWLSVTLVVVKPRLVVLERRQAGWGWEQRARCVQSKPLLLHCGLVPLLVPKAQLELMAAAREQACAQTVQTASPRYNGFSVVRQQVCSEKCERSTGAERLRHVLPNARSAAW